MDGDSESRLTNRNISCIILVYVWYRLDFVESSAMKFMSVREFRTSPVGKELQGDAEIVLTSNGKPVAVVTAVSPETVERDLLAWRRARARIALDEARAAARAAGLDRLTMKEIDAEISRARRARRKKR